MVRALLVSVLLLVTGAVKYDPVTFVVVGQQDGAVLIQPVTPIRVGVFQEAGASVSKGDILHCIPSTRVVPVVVQPKVVVPELQAKFNMNQIVLDCGPQKLAVMGIQWEEK